MLTLGDVVRFEPPAGWGMVETPGETYDGTSIVLSPKPGGDGALPAALVVVVAPFTDPDLPSAMDRVLDEVQTKRTGMTEPLRSRAKLGELPCEKLTFTHQGPKGELSERILGAEVGAGDARRLVCVTAVTRGEDSIWRAALDTALRSFALVKAG